MLSGPSGVAAYNLVALSPTHVALDVHQLALNKLAVRQQHP